MLFTAGLSFVCQLFLSRCRQISSWLQASFSLVSIHQGVQLRWVGTTLHTAAPNTPEQHVHTVTNGYHPGGGVRPCRGWWWCRRWPWKEKLPVSKEEELHHISPLGDHWVQWWRCENTEWRFMLNLRSSHEEHFNIHNTQKHGESWYILHRTYNQCTLCLLYLDVETRYEGWHMTRYFNMLTMVSWIWRWMNILSCIYVYADVFMNSITFCKNMDGFLTWSISLSIHRAKKRVWSKKKKKDMSIFYCSWSFTIVNLPILVSSNMYLPFFIITYIIQNYTNEQYYTVRVTWNKYSNLKVFNRGKIIFKKIYME